VVICILDGASGFSAFQRVKRRQNLRGSGTQEGTRSKSRSDNLNDEQNKPQVITIAKGSATAELKAELIEGCGIENGRGPQKGTENGLQ